MEPSLLTMTQLKGRGWTPALVKTFLGEPDKTRPNPYYRSAAPMSLYAQERVEVCERGADWQAALARARVRSEKGKAAAQRRADELVKKAEQLSICVSLLPADRLLQNAIAAYNGFHEGLLWERGHAYEPASQHSDPAFLERITVNYIRHHLTRYDGHLEDVAGQVGVHAAITVIRQRVYAAIAGHYPEYAAECQRQMQARMGDAGRIDV